METAPIAITPNGALDQRAFSVSLDLPFPVLVDRDGAVAAAFGALVQGTGSPRRASFLVDNDGLVIAAPAASATVDDVLRLATAAAIGITPAY